jgi:hypothetical protein
LALPDICGALEAADGRSNDKRYKQWFDNYVAPKYHGTFDGITCYRFRCSILHQGQTQHPNSQYSRIVFLEPGSSGMVMHNNVMDDVLNIDIRIFCEDVVSAVEYWLSTAQQLPHFASNLAKFAARHYGGYSINVNGTTWIG